MKEEDKKFEKETKETKEVTKEVYKPTEKASISYYHVEMKGYNEGVVNHIEVKDETSAKAYKTFKKIRKEASQ